MINTEVAMVDMEAVNNGVDLEAMVIIEAMEVEVTSTEAVDTDMDTDITAGETSMETVAMAAVATVAMAAVTVGMVVIMVVVVVVTVGDDNHVLNIFIIGRQVVSSKRCSVRELDQQ